MNIIQKTKESLKEFEFIWKKSNHDSKSYFISLDYKKRKIVDNNCNEKLLPLELWPKNK